MLPEIISFNKTMQYRLSEYEQLFDGLETPCAEITEIWGSIFEDLAVISVGWRALWILSEENCKKHNVLYPTAVIVNVEDFNWYELTATIRVIAVQEDIVLPGILDIPIIELHPLKVQDFDETDLKDIEDWIDKCRFFFKNLWYPWDAKIDVSLMDWCESHLRNRLKLHYDIKNGVLDKMTANYLKLLLAEAHSKSGVAEKDYYQEDDRLTVVKKYMRRKILKTELDLFEEPDLRYGMILLKKKEKFFKHSPDDEVENDVKFVWKNGSCQSLLHYLKITQTMIEENSILKVFGTLQEALDSSDPNNTIILPPGLHFMISLRGLENGGIIKGLDRNDSLIVPDSSSVSKAILFECFGSIELDNLTISKMSGIVLQIFGGSMKLKRCKIISTENQSTSKGIVVVSGSKLFLDECELKGFGTAIALQTNTFASIINTKIENCYEGIKVCEDVSLTLQNVDISSCSMFGLKVESSHVNFTLMGDLNLLEDSNLKSNISAISVSFNMIGKANVVVKKPETMLNFEDSLEVDKSNEVIYISDNEETITAI